VSTKTEKAVRAREQAKIRPAPIEPPKKPKKAKIVVEPIAEPEPFEEVIAPDYAESAE
jgi:hypothetical protein